MNDKPFDPTKPCQTRDGQPRRTTGDEMSESHKDDPRFILVCPAEDMVLAVRAIKACMGHPWATIEFENGATFLVRPNKASISATRIYPEIDAPSALQEPK